MPIWGKQNSILDEEFFVRFLAKERARAHRSQKSFLLILFQVDGWLSADDGRILRGLIAGLRDCVRETDFVGWYRQGALLGTVFTELNGADIAQTPENIRNRVVDFLSSRIGRAQVERIPVTLHPYPEKTDRGELGGPPDRQLYPDLEPRKFKLRVKRWMDIVGSLLLLAGSAPLFLLIAPLIACTSPGPIFYRQQRLGQFGRTFSMLKFRTMKVDADPGPHKECFENFISDSKVQHEQPLERVFKLTNDPRVTWSGRWLRRTSLDEIPQFVNVLRGEMSLVGPRPPIPYELEHYEGWHRRRLLEAKPGITGLWQVEGRSRTTFDEMVRLDLAYVRNWSLLLDLKILFRTPKAVVSARGAH